MAHILQLLFAAIATNFVCHHLHTWICQLSVQTPFHPLEAAARDHAHWKWYLMLKWVTLLEWIQNLVSSSKCNYVVLLHQSLCLLVNTTHHVHCSLLPLSPTLCLWQSAYINLSTISSSLFSSIAPSTLKPQTFPNITRNTSSFSSSSQANTVNHSPLKSLPFYFTSFFSNLRSVRMKISACYIPNIFLKCLFQSPPSTQSAHRTHKVQN